MARLIGRMDVNKKDLIIVKKEYDQRNAEVILTLSNGAITRVSPIDKFKVGDKVKVVLSVFGPSGDEVYVYSIVKQKTAMKKPKKTR